MTTYNKSTLKTFFQTSDIPDGSDYANFIDSYVNIVETSNQAMAGSLYTTELDTAIVSAGGINCTGTISANNIAVGGVVVTNLSVSGEVSAAGINVLNSVRCSALRFNGASAISIVSALGTAQATGAPLTFTVNRLQGVTDGQTTGFLLPAPNVGTFQYLINETAVSANLWPSVGCAINGNAANAVFALAAKTSYVVIHTYSSGYGVK